MPFEEVTRNARAGMQRSRIDAFSAESSGGATRNACEKSSGEATRQPQLGRSEGAGLSRTCCHSAPRYRLVEAMALAEFGGAAAARVLWRAWGRRDRFLPRKSSALGAEANGRIGAIFHIGRSPE